MHIVILQGAFFPVPPLLGGAVEKMWFKLGQVCYHLAKEGIIIEIIAEVTGLPEPEIKRILQTANEQ